MSSSSPNSMPTSTISTVAGNTKVTHFEKSGVYFFGIFLWIIAIFFLLLLIFYQSGCYYTISGGSIGSYDTDPWLDIITYLIIFFSVLIGSYFIFTTWQLITDSKKLTDAGKLVDVSIINSKVRQQQQLQQQQLQQFQQYQQQQQQSSSSNTTPSPQETTEDNNSQ